MPCIMVQGTMSGAGKSTIATALCRILSNRGYDVAPFKSQNMSGFSYGDGGLRISRAQAVQAVAARCPITPEINPVLLVPRTDRASEVYVMGRTAGVMDTKEYYRFAAARGISAALGALDTLRKGHDIIVMEGAGSPAEVNVPFDMANMRMAGAAGAAVLVAADIERGGCFAQMVGTISLLEESHREMIRGFVINKFRGDPDILEPGIRRIRETTGKEVLGVLPYMETRLPPEDSLDADTPDPPVGSRGLEDIIDEVAAQVESHLDMNRIMEMVS